MIIFYLFLPMKECFESGGALIEMFMKFTIQSNNLGKLIIKNKRVCETHTENNFLGHLIKVSWGGGGGGSLGQ